MHGLQGIGAEEKRHLMPDPLPLRSCVGDMDMVRPWGEPWGLSPSMPLEARAVPTALCGCSRPVGPRQSSLDANIGRVCNCHLVVTFAASIRCAWYGLTSPLDAEQSTPGPGT